LKVLKEERDLERLSKTPQFGKGQATIEERLLGLREALSNVENEKIGGSWRDPKCPLTIPRGQAVMDSILHECWVIVASIQS
jgi:hypothetical protein